MTAPAAARAAVAFGCGAGLAGEILADKQAALAENLTQGALYFHASYVSPQWEEAKGLVKTVQIGQHIFYRPKDAPSG